MEPSKQFDPKENSFLSEVVQASGETIQACFQCQKCSAGCPIAYAMDILPNQVLRHIQYGHREKVLSSKTIWICASCYTCSVRCPNNIDIAKIMDTLRSLSIHSGVEPGEKDVPVFHSVFLDTIKIERPDSRTEPHPPIQIEDQRFSQGRRVGVEDVSQGEDQNPSFEVWRWERDSRDLQRL